MKLWICIWSARDDVNTNHSKIDSLSNSLSLYLSLSIFLYLYLSLPFPIVYCNVEQLDKFPLHKIFSMNMSKAANVTKVEIYGSIFHSMKIMASIFFSFVFEAQFFHLLSQNVNSLSYQILPAFCNRYNRSIVNQIWLSTVFLKHKRRIEM